MNHKRVVISLRRSIVPTRRKIECNFNWLRVYGESFYFISIMNSQVTRLFCWSGRGHTLRYLSQAIAITSDSDLTQQFRAATVPRPESRKILGIFSGISGFPRAPLFSSSPCLCHCICLFLFLSLFLPVFLTLLPQTHTI